MIVYVESNFLLELVLEQEQSEACSTLFELAREGKIRLAFPAFCVGECLERVGRNRVRRIEIQGFLKHDIRELGRSRSLASASEQLRGLTEMLVESAQAEEQSLRQTLKELVSGADIIPLDGNVLKEAAVLRERVSLPTQDSIVLASVLSHLNRTAESARVFINKNSKDFEDPDVTAELRARKCELKTNFDAGLGYVQHLLKSGA